MKERSATTLDIGGRQIGSGEPVFVIAEISANHRQDFDEAVRLVDAAADAGADAVKLQTYTPDTITIDCASDLFRIDGTMWEGKTLHSLYSEAFTPWEWHEPLMKLAAARGLLCFSSPFDESAVELLESLDAPAYKIASFEAVDIPLIRRVAQTGKPVIISTGMATLDEIGEAVRTARDAGAEQVALLKCTSAYPARPETMNLRAIPFLQETFATPVGLSDHTLGDTVPVAAVALGACIIEKHLTLSRAEPGPDSAFSMEPSEFSRMTTAVRIAHAALGQSSFEPSVEEDSTRRLRRSLFVVQDVAMGEEFTPANLRSIRPGHGLHTRHLEEIIGSQATRDIRRGTPLEWGMVAQNAAAPGRSGQ